MALWYGLNPLPVSSFKGRWVVPLLCVLPLAAFAVRPELQRHARGGRYSAAIAVVAVAILIAAGARPWISGLRGDVDELNHPALQLADALRQAGYDGTSPIIAADHMMAGMLRLRFPDAPVDACTSAEEDVATCVAGHAARSQRAGAGMLLISRTDRVEPGWWTKAQAGIAPQPVQSIRLPFRMVREGTPPAHYEYIWQPPQRQP